jgi:hypothetical protein
MKKSALLSAQPIEPRWTHIDIELATEKICLSYTNPASAEAEYLRIKGQGIYQSQWFKSISLSRDAEK